MWMMTWSTRALSVRPNTAADVARIMRQQVGTDDEEEVNRRLEVSPGQISRH